MNLSIRGMFPFMSATNNQGVEKENKPEARGIGIGIGCVGIR